MGFLVGRGDFDFGALGGVVGVDCITGNDTDVGDTTGVLASGTATGTGTDSGTDGGPSFNGDPIGVRMG